MNIVESGHCKEDETNATAVPAVAMRLSSNAYMVLVVRVKAAAQQHTVHNARAGHSGALCVCVCVCVWVCRGGAEERQRARER
eukprot:COSAG03_NODE_1681_length_3651_cov_3.501688_1_plen_82_part_10